MSDQNNSKTGGSSRRDPKPGRQGRPFADSKKQTPLDLYHKIRLAERRYRALLDFLPDPAFVLNPDSTVTYVNPAFVDVFGWTLEELDGRRIPFVPEDLKPQVRDAVRRFFRDKTIHGHQTKRLTKDGRLLDIVLNGAIVYDERNRLAGQVITLKDVTAQKQNERSRDTLFRIARALPRHRRLDALLAYIAGEVRTLIDVESAMVILVDETRQEFYFYAGDYENRKTGARFKEIRFPADKGVAGHVLKTGRPLIVPDTADSPFFYKTVDQQAGHQTRNMLDVPIQTKERTIGVLCTVNKKQGAFTDADVALLSSIGSMAALPIENAAVNEQLKQSYREVKSLNQAKDRVIHHFSHEIKTPLAVLTASLDLVAKRLQPDAAAKLADIMARARRNLNRLLEMEYEIEDLLVKEDHRPHRMLATLLTACSDELEVLAVRHAGEAELVAAIRRRIEELFGPRAEKTVAIRLNQAVATWLDALQPKFAHRRLRLNRKLEPVAAIRMPVSILHKVVEGLIKNAVEYTPDNGVVDVGVYTGPTGPVLRVTDTGCGMTAENRRLFDDNYFIGYEPLHYASRQPFDFMAGGKGLDLLRMKIFAERFQFELHIDSTPCDYLAGRQTGQQGTAPIESVCRDGRYCGRNSGTTVTVSFKKTKN